MPGRMHGRMDDCYMVALRFTRDINTYISCYIAYTCSIQYDTIHFAISPHFAHFPSYIVLRLKSKYREIRTPTGYEIPFACA
jgi:hypothetical protein